MNDLPAMPDPAYIYHPSFGEPGTDEYVSDDLYDFTVSGAVDEGLDGVFDEGCDRCVRLYTAAHMHAYARAALAQPAQEPVGIVREVVMHAVGVIVEGNVYATAQHTEMQVMWMDESPPNGTLLYTHPPGQELVNLNHAQWLALENVRTLANRNRDEPWAQHLLRWCEEAGNTAQILRAHPPAQAAQVDALDAKRYRHLREMWGGSNALDNVADSAMKAAEREGEK